MTAHGPARVPASCHVYYRVRADRVSQAGKAVSAIMQLLLERTGIRGLLSRRIAHAADPAAMGRSARDAVGDAAPTWMETYPGVSDRDGFERHLEAAVQSSAFAQCLPEGARRTLEWFEPIDPGNAA